MVTMGDVYMHPGDMVENGLSLERWQQRVGMVTPLTSHDNVPEHVLRSTSVDSTRTVTRPLRSSSAVTNPHEGFEPPPNDDFFLRGGKTSLRTGRPSRFSPTPSIRRGKVAALLREHASPPGVRVTAGGRLVPDGTTPLTSPRAEHFGKYDQYPHVPHLAPSSVPSTHALRLLDGMIVNVGGSEIAQIVNGQFLHVGYTNSTLNLHVPPTNPVVPSSGPAMFTAPPLPTQSDPMSFGAPNGETKAHVGGVPANNTRTRDKVLETYESKLSELQIARQRLDREEVLQREHITPAVREHIVERRMALTNEISELRDVLKRVKDAQAQSATGIAKKDADLCKPAQALAPLQIPPYYMPNGYAFQPDANGTTMGHPSPTTGFYPHFPSVSMSYMDTPSGMADPGVAHYAFPSVNENHSMGIELQERAPNVGLGIMPGSHNKASSPMNGNGGINLDGSVVQPRRSHAIEIKRPDDADPTLKGRLNPTSPIYDPSKPLQATRSDQVVPGQTAAAPATVKTNSTPRRLTRTDPGPFTVGSRVGGSFTASDATEATEHEPAIESFQTGSTATTADFFPNDPQSHSSRNWSLPAGQDSTVNLSNWLPKENEVRNDSLHVTPSRSTNKFWFSDSDSPEGKFVKTAANVSAHSSLHDSPLHISPKNTGSEGCMNIGNRPPSVRLLSFEGKIRAAEGGESAATSFDSTSHCEHVLKHRSSGTLKKSPTKTTSYWAGFSCGLQQSLCEEIDEEYRVGYRDGLLRSKDRDTTPSNINRRGSASFLPLTEPTKNVLGSSISELARRTSLPSLKVPRAPSNTAVNSPLRQSLEHEDDLHQASISFDTALLPSNRSDDTVSPGSRVSNAHASLSRLRLCDPTSPLSERSARNVPRQASSASKATFPSRVLSDTAFDQQRYSFKATAKSSVAPSADQACGLIPQQLDGSAEDEVQPAPEPQLLSYGSPTLISKGKDRASASSSPIKRASSAVYKLTQISGMSKKATSVGGDMTGDTPTSQARHLKPKKEDDPAKMSSPEKAKWKAKWRKRFEELRNSEQKEIDEYKRNNP